MAVLLYPTDLSSSSARSASKCTSQRRCGGTTTSRRSSSVMTVNPYGRPVRFLVTDVKGNRYALSGEEFRWSVNAGGVVLNSSFVKPVNEGDSVQFVEGHGWGHGVGMCQWCAQTYAEHGVAHEDIVLKSFPGAELKRAY